VSVLFAGVAVTDHDAAVAWYERVLGRPPDMRPHATESAWRVADGGWAYVVADPARAGRGLLTLIVDDLDGVLAERGLEPDAWETIAAGRKAIFYDPDGNSVTFAQVG
jgi:catechol 2,3-dioxygenase-like lactoylglutathione lyase family enzyme